MIKMIALDLDGTLMYTDHTTVTQANKKALKSAHDKGAKLAISTGRTLAIIGDVCEQVPEIDYIIYSNGAGVQDRKTGEVIYKNFMSPDFCRDILKKLDTLPAFIEVYIDGVDYVQPDKAKYFGGDILPKEFIEKLTQQMTSVDSLLDASKDKEIEKITIYIPDKDEYRKTWDMLKAIEGIQLASSLPISMEITKSGVNKGAALDGMCKALGIKAEECMAFGDAGNDCEMLEYAKYSFAMANGTQECKQSAKYETKSNAEDGVAYGIMHCLRQ